MRLLRILLSEAAQLLHNISSLPHLRDIIEINPIDYYLRDYKDTRESNYLKLADLRPFGP